MASHPEPLAKTGAGAAREHLRGRITVYRTPDLPQNSIWAAFQDRRSYLWFGTEEGVVRFDGTEWKKFRIGDGLVANFVQAIAEDGAGCIWIGTRVGGLSRFDPVHASDAWRSFTVADGLPDVDVRAITADARAGLWIATRRGLAHLDPSTFRFTSFAVADAAADDASAVLPDSRGMIWAASRRHGVVCIDPATRRAQAVELPSSNVTSLIEDASGNIWAGTHDSGVVRFDPEGNQVESLSAGDGLPDNRVRTLLCDQAGDVWIGTERGVTCLRSTGDLRRKQLTFLPPNQGLTEYMTMSILEDPNGVYWFGSLAGLTCFEPEGTYRAKTWTTFTHDEGLAHNLVTAIHEDETGRYWFGTYGGGVTSLRRGENDLVWESFDASHGLANDIVRAIASDRLGRIWFGTFGGGLSRFEPASRSWKTFTAADGLASNAVRTIRPAPDGSFWAGTDGGGISIFDPAEETPRFQNFTIDDGLPSNRVGSILHDSQGRVWAGTYEGGFAIFENGVWRAVSKTDGLPANDVYCLAEGAGGRFWIGTGGSGLAQFDGSDWRVFTERDGLPNDTIYQVLVESERSIYGSTNRGVFRLHLEPGREVIVAFDRTDGLADDECNGGASLCDRAGRFWIGTLSGVSMIDPRDVPERISPCEVHITAFFVHEQAMDLDRVTQIEDSKHEFAFEYGAVEYVSPQKVRYRTRLEGFDSDWSKVTPERRIRYTNLGPGTYIFKVQARNWGGEWSAAAQLRFEVVPDRERTAREEAIERERIEKKVLETAHNTLQKLTDELHEANRKLREKEIELELQAREDALTGLMNRRYLDLQLQQEVDRALRFARPLTVVMADLDHFKSINDRFSHSVGDEVLKITARLMRSSLRSVDTVARYGGEEFVFLLPETPLEMGIATCEKVRLAIASYPWHRVHDDLEVTASFGCSGDSSSGDPWRMLQLADRKLFEAKRGGRNRVAG